MLLIGITNQPRESSKMRGIKKIQKGNVSLSILNGILMQVNLKAPTMRDDDNKARCPSGWVNFRLWDSGNGTATLSKGVKALAGGGDMPAKRGVDIKILRDLIDKTDGEIEAVICGILGDEFLPIDIATSRIKSAKGK